MKTLPLQYGHDYSFLYPRHNFHGIVSRLEPRRIRVESIRDLDEDPLDPETSTIQPLVRRSRWLVTGLDLDKNAERSFYVDSMKVLCELLPKRGQTRTRQRRPKAKTA